MESCIIWFLWSDLNLKPIGLYREMAVGLDDIQTELADLDIEVASYFLMINCETDNGMSRPWHG